MIKGIGIDLIDNSRIQVLHEKYGQVFAKKILSKAEMIEFKKSRFPVSYLAKHFTSKEALSKALGTGLYRRGIFPSKLTVDHDDMGKPFFIKKLGSPDVSDSSTLFAPSKTHKTHRRHL